jgi:hypothetical protein
MGSGRCPGKRGRKPRTRKNGENDKKEVSRREKHEAWRVEICSILLLTYVVVFAKAPSDSSGIREVPRP